MVLITGKWGWFGVIFVASCFIQTDAVQVYSVSQLSLGDVENKLNVGMVTVEGETADADLKHIKTHIENASFAARALKRLQSNGKKPNDRQMRYQHQKLFSSVESAQKLLAEAKEHFCLSRQQDVESVIQILDQLMEFVNALVKKHNTDDSKSFGVAVGANSQNDFAPIANAVPSNNDGIFSLNQDLWMVINGFLQNSQFEKTLVRDEKKYADLRAKLQEQRVFEQAQRNQEESATPNGPEVRRICQWEGGNNYSWRSASDGA